VGLRKGLLALTEDKFQWEIDWEGSSLLMSGDNNFIPKQLFRHLS
jgi:hypothetical protein